MSWFQWLQNARGTWYFCMYQTSCFFLFPTCPKAWGPVAAPLVGVQKRDERWFQMFLVGKTMMFGNFRLWESDDLNCSFDCQCVRHVKWDAKKGGFNILWLSPNEKLVESLIKPMGSRLPPSLTAYYTYVMKGERFDSMPVKTWSPSHGLWCGCISRQPQNHGISPRPHCLRG